MRSNARNADTRALFHMVSKSSEVGHYKEFQNYNNVAIERLLIFSVKEYPGHSTRSNKYQFYVEVVLAI